MRRREQEGREETLSHQGSREVEGGKAEPHSFSLAVEHLWGFTNDVWPQPIPGMRQAIL